MERGEKILEKLQEEANGGLVAGRMIRVGVGQDWE
jgi:hypothetical protein